MDYIKSFYTEKELPNKFIAIYADGSGCEIFYKKGSFFYPVNEFDYEEYEIDKDWFADAGYAFFIPLPDDFEVWSEG